MESIQILINKITHKIKDLNSSFQIRYNPDNPNKMNFINTLYTLMLPEFYIDVKNKWSKI